MKTIQFQAQQIAGLFTALLGLTVIVRWIFQSALIARLIPGSAEMGLNAPILLFAAGICCFFFPRNPHHSKHLREVLNFCTWLLILLPAVILAQHIFDLNLGIDFLRVPTLATDANPHPGRVAPNACIGFILAGLTFLHAGKASGNKRTEWLLLAAVAGVTLIGMAAMLGHFLKLETLYRIANFNRMVAPTAVGMSVLGLGLWLLLQKITHKQHSIDQHERRITYRSSAVLILVALSAGTAGFAVMRDSFEKSVTENILFTAKSNATAIVNIIEARLWFPQAIATRPMVQEAFTDLDNNPGDREARDSMRRISASFLPRKLDSVRFYDLRGLLLTSTGNKLHTQPVILHRLNIAEQNAYLGWQDGYVLYTENDVEVHGRILGKVIAEQRLPDFDKLLTNIRSSNATSDALICSRDNDAAACAPSRFYASAFRIPMFTAEGKINLPINRALIGETGVQGMKDLRGVKVLAAHTPLSNWNLAMVIKVDAETLYAPLKARIELLAALLIGLVVLGTIALRLQMRPLLTQIISEQKRTKVILENANDAFVAMGVDGLITDWNTEAEHMFGWSAAQAIGQNLADLIIPKAQREAHNAGFQRFIASGTGPVLNRQIEVSALHRSGREIPVELSVAALQTGQGYAANAFLRDISARKHAASLLSGEKERLRVTLSSIGDAVITTDTDGNVTYMNPVAQTMTGWSSAEARGRPLPEVFQIVDENTGEVAANPVNFVLQNAAIAELAEWTTLIQRGGARFSIEDSAAPIRDQEDTILGVVLVFRDVSQARKMAAEMTHQATHDALTGLINRREFERRLDLALKTGKPGDRLHTLLYLDLDQFKIVNDTCGHEAGDELLRQLTSVLQEKMRQTDTLARLGGDEFGVLLEACGSEPALRIANLLRQTVSDFHFIWLDKAFSLGVSIGLVTFSNSGMTLADILRMADAACYVAKDKGRNRIQVYTPDDRELAQHHGEMGWIGRIQKALDEQRFLLYSQKIMALGDDPEEGDHYELLLRMRDEEGNLVPPMAFIPAAERYGLMPLLDRWVIQTAFAQFAGNHSPGAPHATCAINLSGTSICDEYFLDFVKDQFARHKVAPQSICFEVTETAAIANLNQAAALMRNLKEIGCRFSLDDFGSGMSSFAYLKHLPVDYLKIDGGFVKDMMHDPIDYAMVESINHIGQVMGIQTIAEFVESDAILGALRKIGVNFAQGYEVGKPQPAWQSRDALQELI